MSAQAGIPELALSDIEAHAVADALSKLAGEYDLSVGGKAAAWMGLAAVVGPIAGSHYASYRMRIAATGQNPGAGMPSMTGHGTGHGLSVGRGVAEARA